MNSDEHFFQTVMPVSRRASLLLLIAWAVSTDAVGIETARMALPAEFGADAETLRFSGFGGYNEGSWNVSGYQGDFSRQESRLGVFDPLFVSNKGKSSFSFPAPDSGEPLLANCEMRKKSVTIDIVTFDPKKMAYNCDFTRSGALTGDRLILGQPKPANMKERFLAFDRRVGEAIIGGTHLTMKSVHDYEGSAFSSQAPVGYLVDMNDSIVAAVELTDWNPVVYLRRDLDPAAREVVLVAALAIAVLRDPANSALEE